MYMVNQSKLISCTYQEQYHIEVNLSEMLEVLSSHRKVLLSAPHCLTSQSIIALN